MRIQSINPPGLGFEVARADEQPNTLRTDIAGFAGPTQRGAVGRLVRVEGWRDYLARFGGLTENDDTAFALRGYFDNGGQAAYVVRTIGRAHTAASATWTIDALDPVTRQWRPTGPAGGGFPSARYRVAASSPGTWANGMQVSLHYRLFGRNGQPQIDIQVQPWQEPAEYLYGLSPARLVEDVAERSTLIRLQLVPGYTPAATPHQGPLSFTWKLPPLHGGSEQVAGLAEYREAADQLLVEPEVALLVLPDAYAMAGPRDDAGVLVGGLAASAELTLDRQLLAASPPHLRSASEVAHWAGARQRALTRQGARNIAVYHPWIDVDDPLGGVTAPLRRIAPVGHVAGVISRLDRERGAHHTPANAPLFEAVDLAEHYGNVEQAALAVGGVNLLRCQPGRGLVVWGARTLTDPTTDPENLYLAHRRLIHRLVRAIRRVAEPLVFNGNGPELWLVLVRSITSVLMQAFRAGALKGERAEQAFRVVCDESNNPPSAIDNGLVQCEIQVAPAVPMEFITLRIALSNDGRLELIEP
ncbi:MAG: phage tail sheath family protein [Gammaproteobacteria bacterium]